ncbi:MAG TPA: hypothetical protein VMM55_05575 [Thermohalobaculum sp.]|nr:hypothetical protein [Thermohalobaculum sp.]
MRRLRALIAEELAQPVAPEVRALADAIAQEHGPSVAAILFYGSCLREPEREGMLDFYVLVDDYRAFHGSLIQALANRLLPPTILYRVRSGTRAKVAVISRAAFMLRLRSESRDTTVWARFCQPAALVHARDRQAAAWAADAVARAVATAAGFAARLGPEEGTSRDFWCALFRNTYEAELRIERGGDRGALIYEHAAERFDRLFGPALAEAGIGVGAREGACVPTLSRDPGRDDRPPEPLADPVHARVGGDDAGGGRDFPPVKGEGSPADGRHPAEARIRPQVADRAAARRVWRRRCRLGKALNLARLVKAAFTFAPHADYLAWKVERHSGRSLELGPFQRRHPVLAAPWVLWRLYRHRGRR